MTEEIEYMNQNNMCMVCFKKPEKRDGHIPVNGKLTKISIPLQKHHVKYNPQIVAWVHDHCHDEINRGMHTHLIQYEKGESREFYGKQT